MYKPLINAVVVGLFVYIVEKSENGIILNFVILYTLLTIVSLLFQKIEKKKSTEKIDY